MSDREEIAAARRAVIEVVQEATQPIAPLLVIKILLARGMGESAVRSALWHCMADHQVIVGADWRLEPVR